MRYLLFLTSLFIIGCSSSPKETTTPNVVFILADDFGWSQLGCYGGAVYHTPHIDNFAMQGMRFTQAYAAAAVCSPTRAAIMTGKYPARLHLTDFIKGQVFPEKLLKQPNWKKYLPLEEFTLGELFKSKNYKTGFFGKWHLSQEKTPPESLPYNPDQQGFDEHIITYKPKRNKTNPEGDPHNVDTITNRAIQFLETHKNDPFFLFVSHNAIHDPIMESRARIAKFEKDSIRLKEKQVLPVIGAMVERLDQGVGRLLQKMEDLQLTKNTLVIFYSDNGGKETYANQHPFKKGKGWLYEGGIRVPLIVRWPGKVQANVQNDEVISSIDLFPTLADMLGEQPSNLDGQSFLSSMKGNANLKDRNLFWHYPHYHRGSGMHPASAVRQGHYKLIEWYERSLTKQENAFELFDLRHDLSEQHNLMDSMPELGKQLKKALADWKNEVDAQLPSVRLVKKD